MRDGIAADSGARAVEMNAQGLVSAVAGRAVKVLILRVISDHADESAEQDFSAVRRTRWGPERVVECSPS